MLRNIVCNEETRDFLLFFFLAADPFRAFDIIINHATVTTDGSFDVNTLEIIDLFYM